MRKCIRSFVTDGSKPVSRHFNLPNHSHHNMTILRAILTPRKHKKPQKSRTKVICQLGAIFPHGIDEHHSFIHKSVSLHFHQWLSSSTQPNYLQHPTISVFALTKRQCSKCQGLNIDIILNGVQGSAGGDFLVI